MLIIECCAELLCNMDIIQKMHRFFHVRLFVFLFFHLPKRICGHDVNVFSGTTDGARSVGAHRLSGGAFGHDYSMVREEETYQDLCAVRKATRNSQVLLFY